MSRVLPVDWVTRAGFVWGIKLLTFAFYMHNDFCDRDVVIVSRVHLTLPDVAEAPPATMRRPASCPYFTTTTLVSVPPE